MDGAGPKDGPVSYGGLVPDGVAQVVVLADGDEHVGEVTDNVFAVEVPHAAMHGATIQWRGGGAGYAPKPTRCSWRSVRT
ncbi:MAG: hypothetical protein H0W03_08945 [Solirubrobacterales bacterium]|nr:hypothetical protein [Solirubrobacterales bacterium]